MSEFPSGPSNPEQSSNEPVREASQGFIRTIGANLGHALERQPGARTIGLVGIAASLYKFIPEGNVTGALVGGILSIALAGGFYAWAERDQRHLDAQSARLRKDLENGTLRYGKEPKA